MASLPKEEARAAVDAARGHVESGKRQAGERAEDLADAAADMAATLSERDLRGLASLAQSLSDNLAGLADGLQHRSLDELLGDARDLARNNPSMFLFGSVAIGFGLSRFLKASHPSDGEGSPSSDENSRGDATARQETPRPTPSDFENEGSGALESNRRLDVQFDEVEPTPADESAIQRERRS
jgi:hypothetical protein